MRKSGIVAVPAALAVAFSGVVAPSNVSGIQNLPYAQAATLADLYDPVITSVPVLSAGPLRSMWAHVVGNGVVDAEVLEFDSPYPGVEISKPDVDGFRSYLHVTLTGDAIYPESFSVPMRTRVIFQDGSEEVISGEMEIRPIAALVAQNTPADPTQTTTESAPATTEPTETTTETEPTTTESAPATTEPTETTTETEPTTSESAPATTEPTETTTTDEPSPEPEESSSAGPVALVVALVAAIIGVIAFAFNGLPGGGTFF